MLLHQEFIPNSLLAFILLNVSLILKYTVSDLSGVWQRRRLLMCPFLWLTLSGLSNTVASHLISWTVLLNWATGFVLQRQGGFRDGQQVQTMHHPEASGHMELSTEFIWSNTLFFSSLIYNPVRLPALCNSMISHRLCSLQGSSDKTLFWFIYSSLCYHSWEIRHAATYDLFRWSTLPHMCIQTSSYICIYIQYISLLFHCFRHLRMWKFCGITFFFASYRDICFCTLII